ncbi:unnamed protein product, partial [Amoebophrya sp. A25]
PGGNLEDASWTEVCSISFRCDESSNPTTSVANFVEPDRWGVPRVWIGEGGGASQLVQGIHGGVTKDRAATSTDSQLTGGVNGTTGRNSSIVIPVNAEAIALRAWSLWNKGVAPAFADANAFPDPYANITKALQIELNLTSFLTSTTNNTETALEVTADVKGTKMTH